MVARALALAALVSVLTGCNIDRDADDVALCTQWDRAQEVEESGAASAKSAFAKVREMLPWGYRDDATLAWHLEGWEALADDRAMNDPDNAWNRSSWRIATLHRRACGDFDERVLLAIPTLAVLGFAFVKMRPSQRGVAGRQPGNRARFG